MSRCLPPAAVVPPPTRRASLGAALQPLRRPAAGCPRRAAHLQPRCRALLPPRPMPRERREGEGQRCASRIAAPCRHHVAGLQPPRAARKEGGRGTALCELRCSTQPRSQRGGRERRHPPLLPLSAVVAPLACCRAALPACQPHGRIREEITRACGACAACGVAYSKGKGVDQ